MSSKSITSFREQLPLPDLLRQLIANSRWVHPGDEVMHRAVPFIRDPLVFLQNYELMLRESGPLMGPDSIENILFSEYRGSSIAARGLPWIDVEKTLFIIINKWPGDDVGIALDYRTGLDHPRVIGGDWDTQDGRGIVYREITPDFPGFVKLLGLPSI